MRSARRTALDILLKVEKQNAYAAPLLARAVPKFDPRDRRLLVELVYGVLRWRRALDHIIEKISRFPLSRMDATVLNLLRLGAYQVLFLSRIPTHAVVYGAVETAKTLRGKRAGGFVNAVLRRIAERGHDALDILPKSDTAESLAVRTSHPTWLVKRWIAQFGFEETAALCSANNQPPPATLRVNPLKTTRDELLEASRRAPFFEDAVLEPSPIARHGLNVIPLSVIFVTGWIDRGWVSIQDEASQLIGEIVSPLRGERILDACAGIGMKATQLLEISANGIRLLCADNVPWKLKEIAKAAKRLGTSLPLRVAAAMDTPPLANRPIFDKVLLDAPCSNTGVIRRHPERKWRLTEGDIETMARTQKRLLASVAPLVKRDGVLVYSTCSLEREEGEAVIENFLKNNSDFARDDCGRFLAEAAKSYVRDGMFRAFPHHGGMDGFFCARLIRRH